MPGSRKSAIADANVLVNGSNLPKQAYADLLEITVQDDIEAPSMFTLRLATRDENTLEISWADHSLFGLGGTVEIRLGYVDSLDAVIIGEITGMELEMASGEVPILVVRGYDRRHRLLRGGNTRTFVKMKDSDIAAQVGREAGLSVSASDTKVKHDYVVQHGQSDLEFLTQRAAAIGYEVVVQDKTLIFRPHRISSRAALSLRMDRDVIEFTSRMTTRDLVGEVDVRGWDPKSKKAIVGKAKAGQEDSMGRWGGPKVSDKAFGKAVRAYVDQAVTTQAAADRIALGQLTNLSLGFIQGEVLCFGRNEVRAGAVIEITGAGKRFSGMYYVSSLVHTYSPKRGYKTRYFVRRNAQ